jgi:hypothetical protein
MKVLKVLVLVLSLAACSGSKARLPATVYEARDGVDRTGARARATVRPTLKPVAAAVDRGVARAAGSVGLHVGETKN